VKESLDLELWLKRYGILKFRGYFCGFSEARDLFGIIFQIAGAFMKIGGLRVDTQEVQGPFYKVEGIKEFPDLIFNEKFRGSSPRCGGPRAAPVHGGRRTRPRRQLTGGWPEQCPHAWYLTAVEQEGGGNDGEPHQLQEGWRRDGNGRVPVGNNWRRRHLVRVVHGRREKRGGERSDEARGWSSPFYRGWGGACQGEKGGNSQRQCP
jgi:hypothetical protein